MPMTWEQALAMARNFVPGPISERVNRIAGLLMAVDAAAREECAGESREWRETSEACAAAALRIRGQLVGQAERVGVLEAALRQIISASELKSIRADRPRWVEMKRIARTILADASPEPSEAAPTLVKPLKHPPSSHRYTVHHTYTGANCAMCGLPESAHGEEGKSGG